MSRSLGLKAYRALARRGDPRPPDGRAPRPKGELVWLHAAEPGNLIPVVDLAQRLCSQRDGVSVLVTTPDQTQMPNIVFDEALISVDFVPDEHPDAVADFLNHWRPDCAVWIWGNLRPNLILSTAEANIPLLLIDADSGGFDGRRDRWVPDVSRALLSRFRQISARNVAGKKRMAGFGVAAKRLDLSSPLTAGGQALPCDDHVLAEMSAALVGRSVWFASGICKPELSIILSAHRQALRMSHRLLLILLPADARNVPDFADALRSENFQLQTWPADGVPDESTQVLLADDAGDTGLFFRLAPLAFLGSSLVAEGEACDPLNAAALGSAILYGPKVGRHLPTYSRLASAGAARIVNDAAALGTAVNRLVAPDQAATMAHAGWDVITQGAEATDKVIEMIQEALDQRAASS